MDFVAVVDQVIVLLRQRGRETYRTLQLQCTLDDSQLATLKDELLYSHPQIVDDVGRGLVWTGDVVPPPSPLSPSTQPVPQPARARGDAASDATIRCCPLHTRGGTPSARRAVL